MLGEQIANSKIDESPILFYMKILEVKHANSGEKMANSNIDGSSVLSYMKQFGKTSKKLGRTIAISKIDGNPERNLQKIARAYFRTPFSKKWRESTLDW